MFDTKITLFNYDINNDNYYTTVIEDTEFQPIYKTIPDTTQTNSDSSILLIIPYNITNGTVYINSDGLKKEYLSPKEWGETANKETFFTIQNNFDIVMIGDYSSLSSESLNDLKNQHDNIFMINQVKDFNDPLLSHFEITAN